MKKLNKEAVKEAASLALDGLSVEAIAKELNVSVRTVGRWRKTKTWKDEYDLLAKETRNERIKGARMRIEKYMGLIEKAAGQNIEAAISLQALLNSQIRLMANKIEKKDSYTIDDVVKLANLPRQITVAISGAAQELDQVEGISRVLEALDEKEANP